MMNIKSEHDNHISICICTYKRQQMLSNLLSKLQDQITENLFIYSVVVVDNDTSQSARETVTTWQDKSAIQIDYYFEPEQNIALVRNKAVENATGNFIAFIDDDELPTDSWLLNLYKSLMKYSVDGVLGPVKPHYSEMTPDWLIKSKLCVRSYFHTGMMLKNSKYMRTGNVLFCRHIIEDLERPFDAKFGRTGGEDSVFFDHMLRAGYSFVWCNEAQVYEEVPIERQKMKYFVRRALLRGVGEAECQSFISYGTIKSIIAVFAYTISLPFFLVFRYHLFVRFFIKDCDHLAKLLAHFGIKLVRERKF